MNITIILTALLLIALYKYVQTYTYQDVINYRRILSNDKFQILLRLNSVCLVLLIAVSPMIRRTRPLEPLIRCSPPITITGSFPLR